MRMEHKISEDPNNNDLKLTFKSPTFPHHSNVDMGRSVTQQSNLSTTKRIFEEKIQRAENDEAALRAPRLVSQARPVSAWKERPKSDIYCDVYLEPGPEPELCFAPKPKFERKKSLVETLEENIERQLEMEPARVPPGGVRLIPIRREPSMTPQPIEKRYSAPIPVNGNRPEESQLEPFPYTVPELTESHAKPTIRPPPTPSKFVKGTFSDTNYESDFSDYSYFEKKFKHVTPPRPSSTTPGQGPQPLPHVNQLQENRKYDFSPLPLKQMIQSGTPIPLPEPYLVNTPVSFGQQKKRPLSAGYAADTEEVSGFPNRIYNQVGACVISCLVFCMDLIVC